MSLSKKQKVLPTSSQKQAFPSRIVSKASSSIKEYKDRRLKDFIISYDPNIWEIKELKADEEWQKGTNKYTGPGVLFMEKNGDGVINFNFTLAFGMGGGITPFKQEQITLLKNGWARLNNTSYGLAKTIIYYQDKPQELQEAKDYCEQVKKGEDQFPLFESNLCPEIENGTFVGYVPQPTFSRSAAFPRSVPLLEINPSWEKDDYVKNTGIDVGKIIVVISYQGSSPAQTDALIEQLSLQ